MRSSDSNYIPNCVRVTLWSKKNKKWSSQVGRPWYKKSSWHHPQVSLWVCVTDTGCVMISVLVISSIGTASTFEAVSDRLIITFFPRYWYLYWLLSISKTNIQYFCFLKFMFSNNLDGKNFKKCYNSWKK